MVGRIFAVRKSSGLVSGHVRAGLVVVGRYVPLQPAWPHRTAQP